MADKRKSIREHVSTELTELPYNENFIVMGMKAMQAGESKVGSSATKYFCYAECASTNRVLIQVFSFDESMGIQDLKKGQKFYVQGKLNYYRSPSRREYFSIYVEKLVLK